MRLQEKSANATEQSKQGKTKGGINLNVEASCKTRQAKVVSGTSQATHCTTRGLSCAHTQLVFSTVWCSPAPGELPITQFVLCISLLRLKGNGERGGVRRGTKKATCLWKMRLLTSHWHLGKENILTSGTHRPVAGYNARLQTKPI